MGLESYRHRPGGEELHVPTEWYLDDVTIEQVKVMLDNGEIPADKIINMYNGIVHKIDDTYKLPDDMISAEKRSKLMFMEDAAEILRNYIKEDEGSMDVIDHGETVH